MNTKEAVQSLPEYVNVPLAELVESSTNPRKTFDDERLEELAASIRSKGVLFSASRRMQPHHEKKNSMLRKLHLAVAFRADAEPSV
jgi:hypothetical protein